ncbi:MAG: FkbM family methyltransferase [Anaerolineae bacterium]|nr:FkbM family methyltransferase [Anaerolineae bacterium]MDW8102178.1 FkbM family methyltransferase [Anaerolineae bacterium]
MVQRVLSVVRHVLPHGLKQALKGWVVLRLIDDLVWELPPPLSGLKMKGPGVFGTYVEKPYEPEACQILMSLICPGWKCVDVGAHLGYFTLLLAHLVGDTGHVFAFEALPENARWLRENIALNGFTLRVTVENVAVSDGKQPFVRLNAPLYYTSEWSIVRPSPIHRSIEARAICLDAYFVQGPGLDFIKIDIEGAEFMALQGSQTILLRDRPFLLIELHGDEGQRAAHFLLEMGYRIEDLKGQVFSGSPFPSHIFARPKEK